MMFIGIWLPLGGLSISLWIFAYLHEKITKQLNKFGTYLVMYKLMNDPPDLTKIMEKMILK